MAFTDEERVKIRHHLGYLNVQETSTFVLGVPAALQTTFMIEGAFDKILPAAENLARTLVCRLDAVEDQVFGGTDLADVEETGGVKVNRKRLSELASYYQIAQKELANLFGVVPNPFDLRLEGWLGSGMGGINVGVRG
jgi:hypothetical protein